MGRYSKSSPKIIPVGEQEISHLIEGNCIYVDKTPHIRKLIE